MFPLTSILVTTDFSDDARNAVRRAALMAAGHRARLSLLHVVDPPALKGPRAWFASQAGIDHKVSVARAMLDRLVAELESRYRVQATPVVRVGRSLEQVCAAAAEADLLLVGSKRVNPLRSSMLGTPTEQLVRLVRRPVLVVKREAAQRYQRVLVAVDLDTAFGDMLHSASALAPGADLHVFHALSTRRADRMRMSGVPSEVIREVSDSERQRGAARLQSMLAAIGHAGAQVSVDHGDPRVLTLEMQHTVDADLIVLGQDGASALCNFLLGGVPRRVLSAATCDVLVMPKLAQGEGARVPARRTWLDSGPASLPRGLSS
ncbi:universal stress protein [Piscinibacter gummiphilus]|uniref:Universal stress protein n=1 Tax=Piscinibacter gummiphilus TaxID=946333 RepID=A0ABZ0CMD0_9BURK|nr:universal stress protein [Piscinibacter gummiphilus]WOB06039.1 universal stress protein [Piscinibacter gummiphilus]